MLSDNIRNLRKKNNLSQDELAEKIGVSRQSVSFWENGQTQPTIENIIALARVFHVTSDILLGVTDEEPVLTPAPTQPKAVPKKKNGNALMIALIIALSVFIVAALLLIVLLSGWGPGGDKAGDTTGNTQSSVSSAAASGTTEASGTLSTDPSGTTTTAPTAAPSTAPSTKPAEVPFDLFTYCKNFAIEKGKLNGDYCMYQQPATKYGGYENEYFSISYWSDSDMVEFCLHCPLSETQSHNFYLRMRGGYNGEYEYASSKYYRETGVSFRLATGIIDPAVFSDKYPIPCDYYDGSTDGQTDFMEQSRVGICDLIRLIKEFVTVEDLKCDFSAFEFVNF